MIISIQPEDRTVILEALALYAGYFLGEGNNQKKYLSAARLILKLHNEKEVKKK